MILLIALRNMLQNRRKVEGFLPRQGDLYRTGEPGGEEPEIKGIFAEVLRADPRACRLIRHPGPAIRSSPLDTP